MTNPFVKSSLRRAELDARNGVATAPVATAPVQQPQYAPNHTFAAKKKDPPAIFWPNQVGDVRLAYLGEALGSVNQEDPSGRSQFVHLLVNYLNDDVDDAISRKRIIPMFVSCGGKITPKIIGRMKEFVEIFSLDDKDDVWEAKMAFLKERPSKKTFNVYSDFEIVVPDDVAMPVAAAGVAPSQNNEFSELKDILKSMVTMQTQMSQMMMQRSNSAPSLPSARQAPNDQASIPPLPGVTAVPIFTPVRPGGDASVSKRERNTPGEASTGPCKAGKKDGIE